MQTKIDYERGIPCRFFRKEVLMNKSKQRGHQNGRQGVRDPIVLMKLGNASGGKGIGSVCSCAGHS